MIDARNLIYEVANKLEISQTDYDKFKVVESANEAQLELVNILPHKYLRDLITKTRLDLKADTAIYQWPPDYLRFVSAPGINYSSEITESERGIPVYVYDPEVHFKPIIDIATSNFPFIDPNIEGGFEIRPAPTADQNKGLLIRHVYRPPDMVIAAVADNDQDSMLDYSLRNLLLFKTIAISALVEDYRPDLSKRYSEFYEKGLSRLLPKKEQEE